MISLYKAGAPSPNNFAPPPPFVIPGYGPVILKYPIHSKLKRLLSVLTESKEEDYNRHDNNTRIITYCGCFSTLPFHEEFFPLDENKKI